MIILPKSNREDYALLFFVGFLTIAGGYIRIASVLSVNFPVNDGGLFYVMTKDLIANQFRIPVTTTYNGLMVAYAYPPLAFYLAGGLASVFHLDLLDLFRILPALISTLTIPAFYLLAKDVLKSSVKIVFAVLVFAFLPSTFYWPIMGGGLTRSLGLFFSILAFWSIKRYFLSESWLRYGILTSFFMAMAILSHPEAALQSVVGAGVFFWFYGLNLKGLGKSLGAAVCTMVLTAPWWWVVIQQHGLGPFMAAGRTGGYRLDLWLSFLQLNLADEIALTFGGCLAVLGIIAKLAKRDYFLPVWALSIVLAEPRSAVVHLAPCLAILAGFALDEMIVTRLRQMETEGQTEQLAKYTLDTIFNGRAVRILFTYLLIYFIVSAFSISYQETRNLTMSDSSRDAFEWINTNLPAGGHFAVITGDQPLADPVSEWFPAITSQISVATVQGLEWVPGVDFSNILMRSYRLQQCAVQNSDCVANWQSNSGFDFDYIYLEKQRIRNKQGLSDGPVFLQKSLLDSGRYESIYDTLDVTILMVKKIQ